MSKIKNRRDGWHKLQGYDVYIENNQILRGLKTDRNGGEVTAYPYRLSRYGGWDNCAGISVDAFIAGVRRDTIILS